MQSSSTSTFEVLLPYAVFVCGLGVFSVALSWYTPAHFVSEQTVRAVESRPIDVLLLGNSLMVAAYSEAAHVNALSVGGDGLRHGPVVGNAAMGSTSPAEHWVTARRVLSTKKPKVVVYGWFNTQLLDQPLDMNEAVGNRIIIADWARLSDLTTLFPHPLSEPTNCAMWLGMATVPLVTYASLVHGKVEIARRGLVQDEREMNRFGATDEFRRMAQEMWRDVPRVLHDDRHASGLQWSRHILAIRDLAHANGATVMFVAMPITSAERVEASRIPGYADYFEAARRSLPLQGDAFLDATSLPEIDDGMFEDGLHLSSRGAAAFTRWLDRQLANAGLQQ